MTERIIRLQVVSQSGPNSWLFEAGNVRFHLDSERETEWDGERFVGGAPAGFDASLWEAARQLVGVLTGDTSLVAWCAWCVDVDTLLDAARGSGLRVGATVQGELDRIGLVIDTEQGWLLDCARIPARSCVVTDETDVSATWSDGRSGILPLRLAVREGAASVALTACDRFRWDVRGSAAEMAARITDDVWADAIAAAARREVADIEQSIRVGEYMREQSMRDDTAMYAAARRGESSAMARL